MKPRQTNVVRSQNGTFVGDSSYQRLLFGAHYQISRLEAVCMTLSHEHEALLQLKQQTRASITATEADIHALQGHLRSARKKRCSAEVYDGVFSRLRAVVRRGRGGGQDLTLAALSNIGPDCLASGVAQQVLALPERSSSRRRIAETMQEVADLGRDHETLKLQCATLKKQFGVLLQQLDEMAKNVNAAVKDGDAAAVAVEAAAEGDDVTGMSG
jgi:hypothetical protein